MTSEIKPQIKKIGQHSVLYDASLETELTEDLFNPVMLRKRELLAGQALGRGEAWFINYQGRSWVLRHFRRGGLIGRFVADRYLGWALEGSRSWSEWRLLAELYRRGLPVPRPVAASVRRGCGFYRADLLMERIPDSISLAGLLSKGSQPVMFWENLGACLRRFHDQGVYHADLNANNILINGQSRIYLIDFDRGAICAKGEWTQHNLQRLKRSLLKIKGSSPGFHFEEEDWRCLLHGYETIL